jgi:hypothetical protein
MAETRCKVKTVYMYSIYRVIVSTELIAGKQASISSLSAFPLVMQYINEYRQRYGREILRLFNYLWFT